MLNKELTYYTMTQGAHYVVEHEETFVIKPIMKEYPASLWQTLLQKNLPPWLIGSVNEELKKQAEIFPEGQLLAFPGGKHDHPIGGLSSIKTHWDGFAATLYSHYTKHEPNGNTLIVTGILVDDVLQNAFSVGLDHVTEHLLSYAKDLAKKQHVSFLLISLPVTGHWFANGTGQESFEAYIRSKKQIYGPRGGLAYVDPTIQKYAHFWGHLVGAAHGAVIVHASLEEFKAYKSGHKPDKWTQVSPCQWHCEGTGGLWSVFEPEDILPGSALYTEPHVWVGKATGT